MLFKLETLLSGSPNSVDAWTGTGSSFSAKSHRQGGTSFALDSCSKPAESSGSSSWFDSMENVVVVPVVVEDVVGVDDTVEGVVDVDDTVGNECEAVDDVVDEIDTGERTRRLSE